MIALHAGGYDVGPGVLPALATGQDVVDRHVPGRCTAILARVLVAGEDLVPGHLSSLKRTLDHVNEPDHVGPLENVGDGIDVFAAVLDRLRLSLADELHRPANIADIEGLVVLIEHQYWRSRAFAHLVTGCGCYSVMRFDLGRLYLDLVKFGPLASETSTYETSTSSIRDSRISRATPKSSGANSTTNPRRFRSEGTTCDSVSNTSSLSLTPCSA